jgi:type I restriction-modification system DNA methylase subunit
MGLAEENKIEKKNAGKYYTPDDVAIIMAQYLLELPGDNICDLCCGTGNLIFAVLN